MVAENFLMLFAPPGTPKAVIDRIHAASAQAVASRTWRRPSLPAALRPRATATRNSAAKFLADELAHWAPLIQAAGLKR